MYRRADGDRQAEPIDEQGAEHPAQHPEHARGEAEHTRGGEHYIIGDADQRIDCPRCQAIGDDRFKHRAILEFGSDAVAWGQIECAVAE